MIASVYLRCIFVGFAVVNESTCKSLRNGLKLKKQKQTPKKRWFIYSLIVWSVCQSLLSHLSKVHVLVDFNKIKSTHFFLLALSNVQKASVALFQKWLKKAKKGDNNKKQRQINGKHERPILKPASCQIIN